MQVGKAGRMCEARAGAGWARGGRSAAQNMRLVPKMSTNTSSLSRRTMWKFSPCDSAAKDLGCWLSRAPWA